jgi:hypothetical protein
MCRELGLPADGIREDLRKRILDYAEGSGNDEQIGTIADNLKTTWKDLESISGDDHAAPEKKNQSPEKLILPQPVKNPEVSYILISPTQQASGDSMVNNDRISEADEEGGYQLQEKMIFSQRPILHIDRPTVTS